MFYNIYQNPLISSNKTISQKLDTNGSAFPSEKISYQIFYNELEEIREEHNMVYLNNILSVKQPLKDKINKKCMSFSLKYV